MNIFDRQPDSGNWKRSTRELTYAWFGFAVICYCLGLAAFLSPSQSSQTGIWGWLHVLVFNAFGPQGDTVLFVTSGTVCLFFGFMSYRASQ